MNDKKPRGRGRPPGANTQKKSAKETQIKSKQSKDKSTSKVKKILKVSNKEKSNAKNYKPTLSKIQEKCGGKNINQQAVTEKISKAALDKKITKKEAKNAQIKIKNQIEESQYLNTQELYQYVVKKQMSMSSNIQYQLVIESVKNNELLEEKVNQDSQKQELTDSQKEKNVVAKCLEVIQVISQKPTFDLDSIKNHIAFEDNLQFQIIINWLLEIGYIQDSGDDGHFVVVGSKGMKNQSGSLMKEYAELYKLGMDGLNLKKLIPKKCLKKKCSPDQIPEKRKTKCSAPQCSSESQIIEASTDKQLINNTLTRMQLRNQNYEDAIEQLEQLLAQEQVAYFQHLQRKKSLKQGVKKIMDSKKSSQVKNKLNLNEPPDLYITKNSNLAFDSSDQQFSQYFKAINEYRTVQVIKQRKNNLVQKKKESNPIQNRELKDTLETCRLNNNALAAINKQLGSISLKIKSDYKTSQLTSENKICDEQIGLSFLTPQRAFKNEMESFSELTKVFNLQFNDPFYKYTEPTIRLSQLYAALQQVEKNNDSVKTVLNSYFVAHLKSMNEVEYSQNEAGFGTYLIKYQNQKPKLQIFTQEIFQQTVDRKPLKSQNNEDLQLQNKETEKKSSISNSFTKGYKLQQSSQVLFTKEQFCQYLDYCQINQAQRRMLENLEQQKRQKRFQRLKNWRKATRQTYFQRLMQNREQQVDRLKVAIQQNSERMYQEEESDIYQESSIKRARKLQESSYQEQAKPRKRK